MYICSIYKQRSGFKTRKAVPETNLNYSLGIVIKLAFRNSCPWYWYPLLLASSCDQQSRNKRLHVPLITKFRKADANQVVSRTY